MTKLAISLVTALALAGMIGYAFKWYGNARVAEVIAATERRAEGMRAEREIINVQTRNVTVEQRCLRNKLKFVLDDTGGHCE